MKTICSAGQDSMDDPVIYNDTHIHKNLLFGPPRNLLTWNGLRTWREEQKNVGPTDKVVRVWNIKYVLFTDVPLERTVQHFMDFVVYGYVIGLLFC